MPVFDFVIIYAIIFYCVAGTAAKVIVLLIHNCDF